MELSDVILSRRSIRKFKDQDISDADVRRLIDAARLAPSGSNIQPARFIIAQSRNAKELIGRCTPYKFIIKASVIFVCCADLTSITRREAQVGELLKEGAFDGVDVAFDDASSTSNSSDDVGIKPYLSMNVAIAVEHIALRAVDLGLGGCWVGKFDRPRLIEHLALEESIYPVALLPVGYPDQFPKPRPRLALEKLILKTL